MWEKVRKYGNYVFVLLSYGVLVWLLMRYEHYEDLWDSFRAAGIQEGCALVIAIGLFPLNILLEACKWKRLMGGEMSLLDAQRQVYFGVTGAFITPQRLGEYPARLMLMEQPTWVRGLSMSVLGACTMDIVILLFGVGILPYWVGGLEWITLSVSIASMVGVILLLICYPLVFNRLSQWKRLRQETREAFGQVATYPKKRLMEVCGWSALRYVVFGLQLVLMLRFVGVRLSLEEMILGVTLYYVLVTFTPSVSIAEPAIRGSWAVVVFSQFTSLVPQIAIATVLLWAVNTLLPMLVGGVIGLRCHSGCG